MTQAALDTAPPSHTPKFKRLTDTDRAFALRYAKDGLTQTEIAKRLGVSQSAISLWLGQCQDTKAEATQYLDGQALPMAIKAVKKGTPTDLIKLLHGRGVVAEQSSAGLQVVIGIKADDVQVTFAPALTGTQAKVLEITKE